MGDGTQSGDSSGTVTSIRFYVEGDESAPVDVILKSLTDQQHKQLIAQGFLELEDGRVLICEKVDYFYGVSSPEDGEIGRVEFSPSEDGEIGRVEFSPSEDGVIGRLEISPAG
jgi:hypothetical protein